MNEMFCVRLINESGRPLKIGGKQRNMKPMASPDYGLQPDLIADQSAAEGISLVECRLKQ